MPLEKKLIQFPLMNGPDAGTDPKLVSGLVRADNAHWARVGGIEKRFAGMWERPSDIEPAFVMSPTSGWAPLYMGKNLKKWDNNTYMFTTMDDGGLCDVGVTALTGKSDGYYGNVTYLELGTDFYLVSRMEFGNFFGLGYALYYIVETYAKATNALVDSWGKALYPGAYNKGWAHRCLRPVIGYGGTAYIYYIDDFYDSVYYITANPSTGVLTSPAFEIQLPCILDTADWSTLDACLLDDGKTICVAFIGTPGWPIAQPCATMHDTEITAYSQIVLDPAEPVAWRCACWPLLDYNGEATAVVSWYSVWTNTLYALHIDASASIVRSKDGVSQPLDIVSFATGTVASTITGVTTYEDAHTADAGVSTVFASLRQADGFSWIVGVAKGQYEESTSRFNIACAAGNKITAPASPLPLFSGNKCQMVSKPWVTADNQLLIATSTSGKTLVIRNDAGVIFGKGLFEKMSLDAYMDGYFANGFVTDVSQIAVAVPPADGYLAAFAGLRDEGDRQTICKVAVDTSMSRLANTHGALTQTNVVDTLLIPNSCSYQWDGARLVEQGFIDTPRYIDVSQEIGGAMDAGKYWYQVMWSWTDAQGAIHRSVPSNAVSITLDAAHKSVDVRVPTCRSSRKTGIKIEIYRTMVNNIEPRLVKVLENDQWLAGDYIEFTDDLNDSYLLDKPAIYTFGGVIESVTPPPFWVHCVHQARHFVVDRENPNTHIYYSKALVSATAVEHSDSFLIKVPPTGGEINALASMMDRLIVLKRDAIFVISGSGPDPLGANAAWSEPYMVSASVGCSNRRSVIEVPDGIMFRSRQGIVMLNKSLQINFIGEPVRHWTDNGIISGVVARRDKSVVIWFLSSNSISGSRGPSCLVYNWKHNTWTTWSGDQLFADSAAVMYDDRIWIVDGLRTRYSADNYFYDVTYDPIEGLVYHGIPLALETGWITLANQGGLARLYKIFFIGQLTQATDKLKLQIAYDYDGYYSQNLEFDTAAMLPFDFSQYYEEMNQSGFDGYGCILEAVPPRQKCTAIKLRLYDDPDGYGRNWSACALAFLVGVKPQGDQGVVRNTFTKE